MKLLTAQQAHSNAGKFGQTIKKIKQAKCTNFELVKLTPSQEAGILSLFRALPSKKG